MTEPQAGGVSELEGLARFLRTDNGQRIALCVFAVVSTLVLLFFPGSIAAYAFGLPFMFFVPGFAVVRLFFWKGTSPEAKFVLSLGLSILVVIFLGLFLVLTPIGLGSDSTRASLIVFTLGAVALDVFLPRKEEAPRKRAVAQKGDAPQKPDKVVAAMLATALVVSGVSLGLIVTADYPSRTYFALTDTNDMVVTNTTFPINATLELVLHMKNGEDGQRNFTLVAYALNDPSFGTQTFSKALGKGDTWNQTVVFELVQYGYFRLDFDLYIQEGAKAPYLYGNLHLWISVGM